MRIGFRAFRHSLCEYQGRGPDLRQDDDRLNTTGAKMKK
jgi:hypothetical protein